MDKVNKQQKYMITKNNQNLRQRMSTLGTENTQLKSALEASQQDNSEELIALEAAAPAAAESTPAPLTSSNGCEKRKELWSKFCRKKSRNRPCKRQFPIHLIWRVALYV